MIIRYLQTRRWPWIACLVIGVAMMLQLLILFSVAGYAEHFNLLDLTDFWARVRERHDGEGLAPETRLMLASISAGVGWGPLLAAIGAGGLIGQWVRGVLQRL